MARSKTNRWMYRARANLKHSLAILGSLDCVFIKSATTKL